MIDTLTAPQIDTLIEKLGGSDSALGILSGRLAICVLPVGSTGSTLTVPDDLDFEQRIERGAFGWRHESLSEERFPVIGDQIGERDLKLFHFARNIPSEEAERLIRETGYQPAGIGAILAFGAAFPDTQVRHPVVGLGSAAEVDGKGSVPTLWFDGERRTIDLVWLDGDWHRNYRFLGVRETLPAEAAWIPDARP